MLPTNPKSEAQINIGVEVSKTIFKAKNKLESNTMGEIPIKSPPINCKIIITDELGDISCNLFLFGILCDWKIKYGEMKAPNHKKERRNIIILCLFGRVRFLLKEIVIKGDKAIENRNIEVIIFGK